MNLLSVNDVDVRKTVALAREAKVKPEAFSDALAGKTVVTIYEKPSTRTKISFEIAANGMGAHVIDLQNSHLKNKHEDAYDTARVISEYADFFAARVYSHAFLREYASFSSIPVINLLSDEEHPCQALADLLTINELKGFENVKVAFVGDGNNVCNSLMLACVSVGIAFSAASPEEYAPAAKHVEKARKLATRNGSELAITASPEEAVASADVVYTDVWASIGQENAEEKIKAFAGYQVNPKLMGFAKPDAIFMHCLPALKGFEVEKSVAEGLQSVVIRQAGNRVHAQKAVLLMLANSQKL